MEKFCLISVIVHFIIVCQAERDFFPTETSTLESADEYVDPHSFYYDKDAGKEVPTSYFRQISKYIGGDEEDSSSCERELRMCKISQRNNPRPTDIADELLSRRFVNTLLSRIKFKHEDQLSIGYLEVKATDLELETLRKFGNGQSTLREVDPILNRVMRTPTHNGIYESARLIYDMTAWIYSAVLSLCTYVIDNKGMVVAVLFTLYVVHALRKMRYNLWTIVPFGMMTIMVMSFFITWWKLIQEAEISHSTLQMKHLKLPIHCQPDKMSFLDKFTTWFSSSDDCKKYHEARMKTPFLQVTPALALSHMLSHVLYEPIALSGKAVASFLHHVTADMSPFFAGIVQIFICVTFLPGLICCFIVLAGGSLTLGGFGPLSFFSLKGPINGEKRRNKSLESKAQRAPIEILLNVSTNAQQQPERGMIEQPRSRGSNKLALNDKTDDQEMKNETDECTVKSVISEVNGSLDDTLRNDNSDTEADEPVETEVKSEAKKSREVGSGDHAG